MSKSSLVLLAFKQLSCPYSLCKIRLEGIRKASGQKSVPLREGEDKGGLVEYSCLEFAALPS